MFHVLKLCVITVNIELKFIIRCAVPERMQVYWDMKLKS